MRRYVEDDSPTKIDMCNKIGSHTHHPNTEQEASKQLGKVDQPTLLERDVNRRQGESGGHEHSC